MSSYNLKAHGGSANLTGGKGEAKNTGLIITNTLVGKEKGVHMKHLDALIGNTTGIRGQQILYDGVLTSTRQGLSSSYTPELTKNHHVGKTQPVSSGQVPYSGKKY